MATIESVTVFQLVGGLAILLLGARWFVGGLGYVAQRLGVPRLVVGMTMAAFGTSTPEFVVNALAAVNGSTELAFGNIVGSCIVNIGFVLAITAILQPLRVEPSLITREIPMLIVAIAALVVLACDTALGAGAPDRWVRADGLILLLLFAIFLYYTVRQVITAPPGDPFLEEVSEAAAAGARRSLQREVALAAVGLVGVSLGAQWTVDAAVVLARSWGVSEVVIGLTVISLGTTLPELFTCILAARSGEPDIALGNVVGSNLFNVLFIGGVVAVIRPVSIPAGGHMDLAVMAVMTALLLPIAIRSGRMVTRGEGAFLLCAFAGYLGWRLYGVF